MKMRGRRQPLRFQRKQRFSGAVDWTSEEKYLPWQKRCSAGKVELVKFFTSLFPKSFGAIRDGGRMQTNERLAMRKKKFLPIL